METLSHLPGSWSLMSWSSPRKLQMLIVAYISSPFNLLQNVDPLPSSIYWQTYEHTDVHRTAVRADAEVTLHVGALVVSLGGAPEFSVCLPLAAVLPGLALVVGHSLPGEGEDAGFAFLGAVSGPALQTGLWTLAPVPSVRHVGPVTGGGRGAPGNIIRPLVLQHSLIVRPLPPSSHLAGRDGEEAPICVGDTARLQPASEALSVGLTSHSEGEDTGRLRTGSPHCHALRLLYWTPGHLTVTQYYPLQGQRLTF